MTARQYGRGVHREGGIVHQVSCSISEGSMRQVADRRVPRDAGTRSSSPRQISNSGGEGRGRFPGAVNRVTVLRKQVHVTLWSAFRHPLYSSQKSDRLPRPKRQCESRTRPDSSRPLHSRLRSALDQPSRSRAAFLPRDLSHHEDAAPVNSISTFDETALAAACSRVRTADRSSDGFFDLAPEAPRRRRWPTGSGTPLRRTSTVRSRRSNSLKCHPRRGE